MTPSLKISEKIINRVSNAINISQTGKLYGILEKNLLIVLGIEFDSDSNFPKNTNFYPAEIDLCGFIQIGDGSYNEEDIKNKFDEVYVTDNPVFVNYNSEKSSISAFFQLNGNLKHTEYSTITQQELLEQYLYLQLKAQVTLISELNATAIKESFIRLRKNIASGTVSFNFLDTNICLLGNGAESGIAGATGDATVNEIYNGNNEFVEGNNRKSKAQKTKVEVLEISMLKKVTTSGTENTENQHAPLCVLDKKVRHTLTASLKLDALSMIHRHTKITRLYEILIESAVRNLRLIENRILESLDAGISQPEIFHFYPKECGHFITIIYLKKDDEKSLAPLREKLHRLFLLPMKYPIFRRPNAFNFNNPEKQPLLLNPHEGIKPTDNGGKISLVKGTYQYYHYCQANMDDNGWGCAYRSLQTLASWFKLQGYTSHNVPTFREIQKCLVDIGDKPSSFIDSKQWIGSTEVNFVLNTLLHVTCKILYVSSGEEMGSKGPELLYHFENYGSPIMIGGGVLAHTILGVDYNSQTGNVKFLILDPHYTGAEDLKTIQNKGWCGWKGVDFWNKTAYYNMCLPQVPQEI